MITYIGSVSHDVTENCDRSCSLSAFLLGRVGRMNLLSSAKELVKYRILNWFLASLADRIVWKLLTDQAADTSELAMTGELDEKSEICRLH